MQLTLYFSESCRHCQRFHKTIDKLAKERPDMKVLKIKYDSQLHLDVRVIPTVVVSYGEQELGRFSSALNKRSIDNWLNQLEKYISTCL